MFGFDSRAKAVRENPELMHERKLIAEKSFERTDRKAMGVCAVVGAIFGFVGFGFELAGKSNIAICFLFGSFSALLAMWYVNRADQFKVRIRQGKIAQDEE